MPVTIKSDTTDRDLWVYWNPDMRNVDSCNKGQCPVCDTVCSGNIFCKVHRREYLAWANMDNEELGGHTLTRFVRQKLIPITKRNLTAWLENSYTYPAS